ncbi:MAG: DUF393 domain-containing protein [Gammaproteobacteria bacterium]|nr:DUF393 domain-containing protein [Gammaproteobacteria bacterium]
MKLRIFYDSHCPLCLAEMRQLKHHDHDDKIELVNLHDEDFTKRYPNIDPSIANDLLHGQSIESGELLYGLDVTCKAWHLVGKHKWLMMLRWPVVRYIADAFYYFFARYRSRISYLLTGKSHCECTLEKTQINTRQ